MSTVYKYKKRKKWEKEDMSAAIIAVREKKMGKILKGLQTFECPEINTFSTGQ